MSAATRTPRNVKTERQIRHNIRVAVDCLRRAQHAFHMDRTSATGFDVYQLRLSRDTINRVLRDIERESDASEVESQ